MSNLTWMRPMIRVLAFLICIFPLAPAMEPEAENGKTYVGSEACKDCHGVEYKNFKAYSKKVRSFESVTIMKKGLTEKEYKQCLVCHTTGYGRPGGFTSEKETPHLREA